MVTGAGYFHALSSGYFYAFEVKAECRFVAVAVI
jgi:hypothetical protein